MKPATKRQRTLLRKLSSRKHRYKERKFLVEGLRAAIQVIKNGILEVDALFAKDSPTCERLQYEIFAQHTALPEICKLDQQDMEGITDTENTQGILALCSMPEELDLSAFLDQKGIILATDQLQDPGNMGTLIRTSAWFGLPCLIAGKGSADPYHPKVVRSTAGALGTLPVINTELNSGLTELEHNGWQTVLLDARPGSISLDELKPHDKRILVVGNEGNGISEDLFSKNRISVHIQGENEQIESLNASVAASIAIWHCVQLR